MSYQALIFDAGGVFVPHDNEQLFVRLAGRCSGGDALDRIRARSADRRIGTGETTAADVHAWLSDELGYGAGPETFLEDWSCHLVVDHDMLELMTALSENYRVEIFSNTNAAHWARVTELAQGGLDRFQMHLSHEIGAVKPDVSAFLLVAERAGIEPGCSLFIDDVPDNVEGARRAGFQAEQFTSQGALEALLQARGVRWTRPQQEIVQ